MALPKGRKSSGKRVTHKKKSKFSDSRLRRSESQEEDVQPIEQEENLSDEYNEESEEDTPQKTVKPYQRLLSSFNINLDKEERPRKRRKVVPEAPEAIVRAETEPDRVSEVDELDNQSDPESNDAAEESASEDDNSPKDSFEMHFANTDPAQLNRRIGAISNGWTSQRVP